MKTVIFLTSIVLPTLIITNICKGQRFSKLSPMVAFTAMNTTAQPANSLLGNVSTISGGSFVGNIGNTATSSNKSGSASTTSGGSFVGNIGNTATNTNQNGWGAVAPGKGYINVPIYTTSVTINYSIPIIVFFDWFNFQRGARAALSYGPGPSNYPNYLPFDVPNLNTLAYDRYLNPIDYGRRTFKLQVRQWNGNLNWYSSTTGGGQFVKNWVTLFLPVYGNLDLLIR